MPKKFVHIESAFPQHHFYISRYGCGTEGGFSMSILICEWEWGTWEVACATYVIPSRTMGENDCTVFMESIESIYGEANRWQQRNNGPNIVHQEANSRETSVIDREHVVDTVRTHVTDDRVAPCVPAFRAARIGELLLLLLLMTTYLD